MAATFDRVTRADVVRAIKEYDRLGPERFFADHFSPRPRLTSSSLEKRPIPAEGDLGHRL
jgi:hypothetical protein